MKQCFSIIALVCVVAQSAFAQQENDSVVIQGYQYASASSGALSSPTMIIDQPGGLFEKINDEASVFQLPPGETLGCRFTLPEKAFDVKAIVAYNAPNDDAKGLVRWNGVLFPEEQAVLVREKGVDLVHKEIPLKEFNRLNDFEIVSLGGPLQIRSVKILYNYRMPSCTVGAVTVTILSPDPDFDVLTQDLKLTWKGTGPCESGWITIKYKDGDEWKTVPGVEAIDMQDETWRDKFHGQFVWKKHGLKNLPELKIEYSEGNYPERENANQIVEEAKNLLQERKYNKAIVKINEALKKFPHNENYKQIKQSIADQMAIEAIALLDDQKFDDALDMLSFPLKSYPDNNEYKQIKDRIARQIFEGAKKALYQHNYDYALSMIDKALNIYSDNSDFKHLKHRILFEKSKKEFNEQNYNSALYSIEESLRLCPNRVEYLEVKQMIFYERAKKAYNERNYEKAVILINEALSFSPNNNEFKQLKHKIYYERAIMAYNDRNYDNALIMINESLKLEPNNYIYNQLKQKIIFRRGGNHAGERVVIVINGVEFAFRWCPPGTFMMGSPTNVEGRFSDEKQHQVTLTKGFWIMEMEVTQKQWKAVMGINPSNFKGDNLPVEEVSWNDCQEFCRKCAQLGLPVQLPTEAQWEYSCRAGTTGAYAGNLDEMAWYDSNSNSKTHPVGTQKPNAWGLYDMHGNVREWCQDWKADYPSGSVTDPTGPSSGSHRVYRGGSWSAGALLCRSAFRGFVEPGGRIINLGFRCLVGQ